MNCPKCNEIMDGPHLVIGKRAERWTCPKCGHWMAAPLIEIGNKESPMNTIDDVRKAIEAHHARGRAVTVHLYSDAGDGSRDFEGTVTVPVPPIEDKRARKRHFASPYFVDAVIGRYETLKREHEAREAELADARTRLERLEKRACYAAAGRAAGEAFLAGMRGKPLDDDDRPPIDSDDK